jgi:hypothetical protein
MGGRCCALDGNTAGVSYAIERPVAIWPMAGGVAVAARDEEGHLGFVAVDGAPSGGDESTST